MSGMQQLGLGVADMAASFRWYGQTLGIDIAAFRDEGVADLMLRYTKGRPRKRRAVLAVSIQGGAGLEIWQALDRSVACPHVRPGDLGICWGTLKARDVQAAWRRLSVEPGRVCGGLVPDPGGEPSFFLRDPAGNLLRVVAGTGWFARGAGPTGGVAGCAIGVMDVEKARVLYSDGLGWDRAAYDVTGTFPDFAVLSGGDAHFRRVLLERSVPTAGAFSEWLGPSRIELVQCLDRPTRHIFEGRRWGDQGYMHVCFEVRGMDAWKERLAGLGFPFTVDTADSFSMGGDAGRFAYCEDPDGTLVELVETHRLGIVKKLGWYLDLRRRPQDRPLPRFLLGAMRMNRERWT
jgi:catechol 2,3-dioxygenase-like lactoylglutathione lyase family enzyme